MAHILVLEDNHDMMQALSEVLNMFGHSIAYGYTGQEGVNLLLKSNRLPDIILSDVTMPEMDGFEFMQHLHDHPGWNRIPIAIMSGRRSDEKIALEHGASAFLLKPFKFEDLTNILHNMLAST